METGQEFSEQEPVATNKMKYVKDDCMLHFSHFFALAFWIMCVCACLNATIYLYLFFKSLPFQWFLTSELFTNYTQHCLSWDRDGKYV